jgi:DNA primase
LKAMQRSLPHFAAERLPARVLILPAGEDPDSYAARYGVEIFSAPWEEAKPLFAFILDQATEGKKDELEAKLAAFESLKPYFQGEVDSVERSLWLQMAAKRLGVPESALEASLQSQRQTALPVVRTSRQEENLNFEKRFIKLLLTYPEVLSKFDLEQYLDQFVHPEMQTIAHYIHSCYQQVGYLDHSLLITQIEEDAICRRICSLALAPEEYRLENVESELEDYTRNIKILQMKREVQRLQEEMTHVHKTGKGGDTLALQAQWQDLRQRLKKLESSH